jgi:hypothetical protein
MYRALNQTGFMTRIFQSPIRQGSAPEYDTVPEGPRLGRLTLMIMRPIWAMAMASMDDTCSMILPRKESLSKKIMDVQYCL